jgi:hypothetical protein
MFTYITYAFYNIVFQIISLWFLFYANTYINSKIIPDSLRWQGGELRENLTGLAIAQTIVLIIEVAILAGLLHFINKKFLSNIDSGAVIANWTVIVYLVISLAFVSYLIYAGFK